MKIKRAILLQGVLLTLVILLAWITGSCTCGEKSGCCAGSGGINLDFSSLPTGTLPAVFTVDKVDGVRIYDEIRGGGASLWCHGSREVAPGNWKDAAVMLLFGKLPCRVCTISAEVHGHGPEARLVAVQQDSSTQTAVCPGDQRVLTLKATVDNPFIYAILSGQEAQWLSFQLR